MNERIRKLALQAGIELDDSFSLEPETIYYLTLSDFEKFAELIVKETMQVVANTLPSNVYLDVADAVIEHFGVEK
jgi:hypothetical protein